MDLVEHCSLCFQRAASALAQGTLFADMQLHMWEGRREEAGKRKHFVEVSFVLVLKTLFFNPSSNTARCIPSTETTTRVSAYSHISRGKSDNAEGCCSFR